MTTQLMKRRHAVQSLDEISEATMFADLLPPSAALKAAQVPAAEASGLADAELAKRARLNDELLKER